MLVHVEIPGMSLNLQDPLLRLTGIHPRQTGGIPIGQVFTDCARDGGVRPIRLPGSGTGPCLFFKGGIPWVSSQNLIGQDHFLASFSKGGIPWVSFF